MTYFLLNLALCKLARFCHQEDGGVDGKVTTETAAKQELIGKWTVFIQHFSSPLTRPTQSHYTTQVSTHPFTH